MLTSEHRLIGLVSVVFLSGVGGLLVPTESQAGAKCNVPPTWGGVIPGKKRFVATFDGAAFCDRQTGLVLEKSPENTQMVWGDALIHCINRTVGGTGQKGWRLPSVPELASLIDTLSTDCMTGGGPW